MNGKEIVTMCAAIIKRQDLNEDLLLNFINQQRRFILRDKYIYRIQKWRKGFTIEDGFVTTPRVKQARYVEWEKLDKKKKLLPLNTIQEVLDMFGDEEITGEPQYYVVLEGGLKIVPKPDGGVINVFGEWYPQDLENKATSEDGLSKEIGDIITYAACAEYFDFLDEKEKANLWRTKGQAALEKYIQEIKRQQTDDRNLFERDPFGNLGVVHGWRRGIEYKSW